MSGNFRKPLAVKAKTRRIGKGQSSSSNPSQRKFRVAAKNKSHGFVTGVVGPKGGLTLQRLQHHDSCADASHGSESILDTLENQTGASDGGFTAESGWTSASTIVMARFLANWDHKSALHQEMMALYGAATEVIRTNGGQESETEYFAVLMTTLESVDTDISRTAAAALLAIFANRVPTAVLRKKFSWITTMCINLLQSYSSTTHVMFLQNLLSLLATCLKSLELAVWNESSTLQVFSAMFPFITDSRPKLRKFARRAICRVLVGSAFQTGAIPTHPASPAVADFCIKLIETASATSLPVSTLHVFGFLKSALAHFPQAQVKATCETLLQVMAVGHPTLVHCGMLTLQSFFGSKPSPATLGPELNAQLVNALYNYQPRIHDAKLLDVWLAMMQEALMNLQRLSDELFLSNLPKFVGLAVNCWRCDKPSVHYTVASVLTALVQKGLQPCVTKLTAAEVAAMDGRSASPCMKVIEQLHRALHYQFSTVWDQVLFVWAACFEVLGKLFHPHMKESLRLMGEMRDSSSSQNNAVIERAIGSAIKTMGPGPVLETIPLKLVGVDAPLDFDRSWLLPILRDNVRNTKLAFFTSYFLPLTEALHKRVEKNDQSLAIVKTYEVLEKQVWSLLPGFCTGTMDVQESFGGIARTLGIYLNTRPDLRLEIMSGLRLLINTSSDNAEHTRELSMYAKNFLPIFFNIYTTETVGLADEGVRLAAYDTIKVFVRIADDALCTQLFLNASKKLSADGLTLFGKHAILDLARSLVCKMTAENVERLFLMAKSEVGNAERKVQKKAYRVLEELCRGPTPACKEFLENNVAELKSLLLDNLRTTKPGSRAPRLRCLGLLLDNLSVEHKAFASSVLSEAVLCVKVNANKVRQAAFEVVLGVGKAFTRWQPEDPKGAVKDLVSQLTAGFTGSAYLVSCTVLAVSNVLHEFKGQYSPEVLKSIIGAVDILMGSRNREIIQAALYFVRMLFVILDTQQLSTNLQHLVSRLCSIPGDIQKHYRIKLRNIFIKLIRKFGPETIVGMLPETHRKLVSNIRKVEERKKRRKQQRGDQGAGSGDEELEKDGIAAPKTGTEGIEDILRDTSDEEDSDNEIDRRKKKKALRKSTRAWIEEQGENDIVDFLDASAGKKITSTDPKSAPKKKGKCCFDVTEDGRLLIVDERSKSGKKEESSSDVEEDADDLLEALSHYEQTPKRGQSIDLSAGEGTSGTSKAGQGATPKKRKAGDTKGASGDTKKGRFEPYAYVPMDRKALNKRFKKSQEFKNIIKAAQKGAKKGQKKAGRTKKLTRA
ncbi:unnamed protein product [Ixodes hexagonus]